MGDLSKLDAVLPLIEAGAALHWLVPFEKRPAEENWSSAPRYSLAQLKERYRKDANIGIRLGAPSNIDGLYLHLLDVDIRRADSASEAWEAVFKFLPDAKIFPSVISGSGGESRHVYFLSDKPFSKSKLAKSDGFDMVYDEKLKRDVKKRHWEIDMMGTGSQVVIPPSIHPVTRLPYRWERALDLDMPMLMEVSSELVASWGARVKGEASSGDSDDDLEAAFAGMPLDLEGDEVRKTLYGLPPEWVEDRDTWWTAGMALHHQFEGSNEGFELWCEWSKQSDKFKLKDAAAVWKSFKGDVRPVRMATLIQAAQTYKLQQDMDFESEGDEDDVFHAPAVVPEGDLSDLLGDADILPPTKATKVEQMPAAPPEDWQHLFHRNEDGELKATLPNVQLMVGYDMRTFGVPAYNDFSQEIVFRTPPTKIRKKRDRGKDPLNLTGPLWEVKDKINGTLWTDSHDNSIRSILEAPTTRGGYGIKVSDRDLRAAVDIVAQENRFHPIRELLTRLTWDGKKRMDTLFIDYLGAKDTPYHRETARLLLLGAVTRVFEPGHKFDFVPILEGGQGKGKSTFVRTLALHWYTELQGDPSETQKMVENMQGAWILEMGEMSAMARSEVNDMKQFVTRQVDKVRLAYGKRATVFPRQCVFIGSTNDKEYLRDISGGRRWWPIECGKEEGMIDNFKLGREVFQIWAEAVHEYRSMREKQPFGDLPLYMDPSSDAAGQALLMQDSRRSETPEEVLAGQITAWLDTPLGDGFDDLDGVSAPLRQETCIAQIWEEMMGRTGSIPHTESTRMGKAMQLVGWRRSSGPINTTAINKRYGKCRVYSRE